MSLAKSREVGALRHQRRNRIPALAGKMYQPIGKPDYPNVVPDCPSTRSSAPRRTRCAARRNRRYAPPSATWVSACSPTARRAAAAWRRWAPARPTGASGVRTNRPSAGCRFRAVLPRTDWVRIRTLDPGAAGADFRQCRTPHAGSGPAARARAGKLHPAGAALTRLDEPPPDPATARRGPAPGSGPAAQADRLAALMAKWLQCCSTRPPLIFSSCGDWWRTP